MRGSPLRDERGCIGRSDGFAGDDSESSLAARGVSLREKGRLGAAL